MALRSNALKLPELVRATFETARANGELIFYPTQVALLSVNSIPVRPACSDTTCLRCVGEGEAEKRQKEN